MMSRRFLQFPSFSLNEIQNAGSQPVKCGQMPLALIETKKFDISVSDYEMLEINDIDFFGGLGLGYACRKGSPGLFLPCSSTLVA